MSTQVIETDVIPKGYLSLEAVAAAIPASQSTIERMSRDGRLRSKQVPRSGRKPERVFLAEDVERLKAQKERRQTLRPPSALVAREPKLLAARTTELSVHADTISAIKTAMTEWGNQQERIGIREKLWLTLEEAQAYSGRSRNWLLRVCKEGRVKAEKDGGWRIRRASLEGFAG